MALIKSVTGLWVASMAGTRQMQHKLLLPDVFSCWTVCGCTLPLNPLYLTNKSVLELGGKWELQNQLCCQLCSCWKIKLPAPHVHEKMWNMNAPFCWGIKSWKKRGTLKDRSTLYIFKSALSRKPVLKDHQGIQFYVCSFNRLNLATWETQTHRSCETTRITEFRRLKMLLLLWEQLFLVSFVGCLAGNNNL